MTDIYDIGEPLNTSAPFGYLLSPGYRGSLYDKSISSSIYIEQSYMMRIVSLDMSIGCGQGALYVALNDAECGVENEVESDCERDQVEGNLIRTGCYTFCNPSCDFIMNILGPVNVTVGINVKNHQSDGALLYYTSELY